MEKQIREIIAQHVGGTYEAKQKCAEEILRLFNVVEQSEQLPTDQDSIKILLTTFARYWNRECSDYAEIKDEDIEEFFNPH
jgi:hypothetical protein